MSKALLVIDLQNDYFPGGAFPLWNTDVVLQNIERAIQKANSLGVPVIHIQHIANSKQGISPFFNAGTPGADILLASLPLHLRLRLLSRNSPTASRRQPLRKR